MKGLHVVQMSEYQTANSEASLRKEEAMITAFAKRFAASDCDKGCVLVEYPDTVKQLMHLKTIRGDSQIIPIFYQLDNEVGLFNMCVTYSSNCDVMCMR
jgi:adenylate kinase family enzyme